MVSPVGLLDSGLMWPVLEPQPGHYVSSLGKDLLAPNTPPPPRVQMDAKKRHSFRSSQEARIQDGYGNARCQSFVPIKLAKTNWIYLGLSLRVFFFFFSVNRFIFSVSFCYFLLTNFTFLKKQYTMVEYKGALDVISKTFRSVGTWYEYLTFIQCITD